VAGSKVKEKGGELGLKNKPKLEEIKKKLNECCLSRDVCGECSEISCPIGFMKEICVGNLADDIDSDQVEALSETARAKEFEYDSLVDSLAEILMQCGNCKTAHFEKCDINLLRQGIEVTLFENSLEYPGDVQTYLDDLSTVVPEMVESLKSKLA